MRSHPRCWAGASTIRRNGAKTVALLGVVTVAALAVGWLVAGRYGLLFALLVAIGATGFAYYYSDRMALRAMRARPVGEAVAPTLHRVVRELSTRARQPMPRIYLSPTDSPNAFATGRGPRTAAVCCTTGLLGELDERELRAVVAHELAHIYNRDILLSSVAGALAAAILGAISLAWLVPVGRDADDDAGMPAVPGLMLALLIAPLASSLVQLSVSRSREFSADIYAARLTGDPLAMADALRKLDRATARRPLPREFGLVATGHLMIAHPFGVHAGRGGGWFCTHPPMAERIARMEHLAGIG
jgi:heat shock protein HtpX